MKDELSRKQCTRPLHLTTTLKSNWKIQKDQQTNGRSAQAAQIKK